MNKKLLSLVFVLLLSLTVVTAYEYADAVDSDSDGVGIAPVSPDETTDIECEIDTALLSPEYEWEKNGVVESGANTDTILASDLTNGDEWTCTVIYEQYIGFGIFVPVVYGSETVTIGEGAGSNTAPILDPILPIIIYEGEIAGPVIATATDAEGDPLTFTITSADLVFDADVTLDTTTWPTDTFEWQTATGDAGVYIVDVEVSDGDLTDTGFLSITVLEPIVVVANDPPTIDPLPDIYVTEGDIAGPVIATGSDPDGDPLMFTYIPGGWTFDGDVTLSATTWPDDTFEWQTEVGDASGSPYTVIVELTDGANIVSTSFEIYVEEEVTTSAPRATDIFLTVNEGDFVDIEYSYLASPLAYWLAEGVTAVSESSTVFVFDADTAEADLTFVYSSPLDPVTGDWLTADGDDGVWLSTLTVTDPDGNFDVANIAITVNDCPLVTVSDVTVTEGDTVTVPVTVSDNDDSSFTYTFTGDLATDGSDPDVTILGSDTLVWDTEAGDAGTYTMEVTVSDGDCDTVETFIITVDPATTSANNCPVASVPAITTVTEGDTAIVTVTATDADGDLLSYSFSSADVVFDADMTIAADTFVWITESGDAGTYVIDVVVSDGDVTCDQTLSFTIEVLEATAVNNCPVANVPAITTVTEGDVATVQVTATDADGDLLSYSFSSVDVVFDADMTIAGDTFEWQTASGDAGTYVIDVVVSDGDVTCDQTLSFTIEVTASGTGANTCPVANVPALTTMTEGDVATVQVTATDADGDLLSYSFSSVDVVFDADMTIAGDTFEWQTASGDAGTYVIDVVVSDGDVTCDQTLSFTIEVTASGTGANTCPVATAADVEVTEGDAAEIEVVAVDADGDTLTYNFASADLDLTDPDVSIASEILSWATEEGDAGVYTVEVTVSDGDVVCDQVFDVTITVNEEPCLDLNSNGICDDEECVDLNANGICDDEECLDLNLNGICDDEECIDLNANGICDDDECIDLNANGICDDEECLDLNLNGICDDEEVCDDVNMNGICDDAESCPVVLVEDVTVVEGEQVIVPIVVTDEDGDDLEGFLTSDQLNIPDDEDIFIIIPPIDGGIFNWITEAGDAGVYTVTVNTTDGQCDVTEDFTITVCEDTNGNGVCDEEELDDGDSGFTGSNYEGDKLEVKEVVILNAADLYSPYDVSSLDVQTTGYYNVEDGYLYSSALDNEIVVMVEMLNKNSFDAREVDVTFIFDGEEYNAAFPDMDRNEKSLQLFSIPVEEDLETGKYSLFVIIENDDMYHKEVFNIEVRSVGDDIVFIDYTVDNTENSEPTFWESLSDFFQSLF